MDEGTPAHNRYDTAQERAALATYLIMRRPMTTAGLARRLGMSTTGLWTMLMKISRRVPIYFDNERGAWCMCFDREEDEAEYGR